MSKLSLYHRLKYDNIINQLEKQRGKELIDSDNKINRKYGKQIIKRIEEIIPYKKGTILKVSTETNNIYVGKYVGVTLSDYKLELTEGYHKGKIVHFPLLDMDVEVTKEDNND